MSSLGSASGTIFINGAPALATLAALRRSSASTVGALNTNGRAAQRAGACFLAVGLRVGLLFKTAVDKAAQLEKRLSYVNAIMNTTAENASAIREVVIKLGQSSAYTANEVADGFTELAKAGATTEDLVGGTGEAMITLGQAADIKLDDAAAALVSIKSTFNLLPKDASRIADVMSGAANASIINVSDMAVSFKYAGGVAAALGASVEDTAASIAILGNAGIKGSTAGTSLRRILLQLTPRTDKAAAAMERLGIMTKNGTNRFYDQKGNVKKLADVYQILQDATKGLTAEERNKELATIFGDRAINSALELAKQGKKGFGEMMDTLTRTSAAEVAAKRLDNLKGSIEILKGTIDSAFINAGAPWQKPIKAIVDSLTKFINIFNHLPGPVQQFIVISILAIGVLSLLAGGFLLTFGVILRAVAVMRQLGPVLRILMINLKGLIWVIRALSVALLTSPLFWIIAAIILVAVGFYLLYKRSEKFRNAINAIGRALKKAFKAVVQWIKDIPQHFKKLVDWIKKNWDLLTPILLGPFGLVIIVIRRFGKRILNFFKNLLGKIGGFVAKIAKAVGSWFAKLPGIIGGWLKKAFKAYVNFWVKLPGRALHALGLVLGRVIKWAATLLGLFIIYGYKFLKAVVGFFVKLPGRIARFLAAVVRKILGWGKSLAVNGAKAGYNFVTGVVSWIAKLPGRIWRFLVWAAKNIWNWGTSIASSGLRAGRNFLAAIVRFFTQLPGRVWSFLQAAWSKVTGWVGSFASAAGDIGHAVVDGIVGLITDLPGQVWGILQRVIGAFTDLVQTAFNAARDLASALWNGFKEGLFGSPRTKIEYAVEDMTDTVGTETSRLGRQIKTLQRLGTGLPSATSNSSISGAAGSTRAISRGLLQSGVDRSRNITIERLEVNNPRKEPASDTLQHQVEKLVVIGA